MAEKYSLFSVFTRFSIKVQIVLGFVPVLLVLIALTLTSNANFNNFFAQSDNLKKSTDRGVLVLEVGRDIVELQRAVSVYSQLGYSGMVRKIHGLEKKLEEHFALLEQSFEEEHVDSKQRFERLTRHYYSYKEQFEDVIDRRKEIVRLTEEEAAPLNLKLQTIMQSILQRNVERQSYKLAMQAASIKRDLLQTHINFSVFLSAPDSKTIQDTKHLMKKILKDTQELGKEAITPESKEEIERIEKLIATYEKKFLEVVNVNRGYLALINVVLPGKATEIDRLIGELEELDKQYLADINEQIGRNMQDSQKQYLLLSVVAALTGIILALLIALGIANSIQRIATTLSRLTKGEKDINIPGLQRGDEVGEMALAAQEFKEIAHHFERQTEKLKITTEEANEARELAEEANYAKSRFLATMSHEIRTPLNGVVGMSELLMNTELTDKQKKYANTINSSADVLLSIIGDILDFSKIEAGEMDINPISMDLYRHIKEMMSVMNAEAEKHCVEFIFKYDNQIPAAVTLDPVRIKQMVLNLVGNAVKFTENGYVIVNVRLLDKADGKSLWLRFEITDSGIGIPLEKQKEIFDNFTQADTSTTREYGGTGLGLAICRKLIELMGGTIGVDSVVGEGSTFWFEIPAEEANNTGDSELFLLQSTISPDFAKGQKILIVDDFAPNREVLGGYLESWNIRHMCVSSGQDALAELEQAEKQGMPYTLALIDYMMPEMGGEDLAKMIHARAESKDMKLIMITAAYKIGDVKRAQAMGFSSCILKPIYASELMDAILGITEHEQRQSVFIKEETEDMIAFLPDGKKPKILVAEDSRVNQMFAEEILKELGCEVEIAVNGALAFERYQKAPYDLILMDCMMPEMDGYETTNMIREYDNDNSRPHMPIVAMTANAMEGDRERCIDAGMDDYITKPARREDIKRVLKKYLKKAA